MKNNYKLITGLSIALMCFTFVFASKLNAQVSTYTFAQMAGTYTPISGGAVVTAGTSDDNTFGALNLGFTFTYNGVAYTQFGLNVNGWLSMGATAPVSSYTPISTGTTNNIIAGLGRDLQLGFTSVGDRTTGSNIISNVTSTAGFVVGDVLLTATGFPAGTTITTVGVNSLTVSNNATTTGLAGTITVGGEIRYETLGTSPNSICVVQWTRTRRFGTGATTGRNDLFNFQIRLYETSNVVEVVYGPFVTNATSSTYQIGLRGNSNADFNNRTTTTDWSATTAGGTNAVTETLSTTVFPASGQTYAWTPPPPPACATPSAMTVTPTSPTTADVIWTCAACTGTFTVEYGPAGFTPGTGAAPGAGGTIASASAVSPFNLTGLPSTTITDVYVRQDCGGSGFSANTTVAK